MGTDELIELIREAFSHTDHPGDGFLLGSREGDDAFEAVESFRGHTHWSTVDASVLDENYDALSFLSEGGFRFFLPAFLIADVKRQLETADAVFHLASSFHDTTVQVPVGDDVLEKRIGRSALLNPRRYGAITFEDYTRYRLSVFTREEAVAIVAYLEYRAALPGALDAPEIAAALESFWRPRASGAPTRATLADHIESEARFQRRIDGPG